MNAYTTHLHPDSVRRDAQTQIRAKLDNSALEHYELLVRNNEYSWPFRENIVVFFDGDVHWMADGRHREQSWIKAFEKENKPVPPYPVDVYSGTLRDAIRYSLLHSNRHGVPLTRMDRRLMVVRLLEDNEWTHYSNREIARIAEVDEKTVRNLRKKLEGEQAIDKTETTGQAVTMETAIPKEATLELKAEKPTTKVESATSSVSVKPQPEVAASAENPQLSLISPPAEDPQSLYLIQLEQADPTRRIIKLATPLSCVTEKRVSGEATLCEQPAFLARAWMEYHLEQEAFLWVLKPVCGVCADREMEAYLAMQN